MKHKKKVPTCQGSSHRGEDTPDCVGRHRFLLQFFSKGYCKKHELVIQPCKKKLNGFNGYTSLVVGLVHVLVAIGKWKAVLSFYVLDY